MPRQCFRKRFSAGQSSARPAPLTLITATSKRMFQAGTYHGFSRSAGSTTFRVFGKSPAGRSLVWSACRRATPCRSRRPPTTTRAWGSPCKGRTGSATPTICWQQCGQVLQHRGLCGGAAVCHRKQFAQPGSRAGSSECGFNDRQDVPHYGVSQPRIPRGGVPRVEHASVERSQRKLWKPGLRLNHQCRKSSRVRVCWQSPLLDGSQPTI